MQSGALRYQAKRLRNYLDEVAEYWIGYTLPPVEKAIELAEWTPDKARDYCGRCGDSVGPGEATASGCASCRGKPAIADGVIRLGSHSSELRQWIIAIKYSHRWTEMAELLGTQLGQAVSASGSVDLEKTVVVPMPMPWQRRLYRGIDHARVVAWAAARTMRTPMIPVLAQANGPPRVGLTPGARAKTAVRGLRLSRRLGGWDLRDLNVVLVDDVRTTGASLKAATRLLRPLKPHRVIASVLAVSDDSARRERGVGMRETDGEEHSAVVLKRDFSGVAR